MKFQNLAIVAGILAGFAAQSIPAQTTAPKPVNIAISGVGSGSYLGVGIKEVDSDRAKRLKLKQEAGVEVTRVDENSPAEKAGLKAGDVILEYNGMHVEGIEQFSRLVRETPAGREVTLGVSRNGSSQNILAKVGSKRAVIAAPFDMGDMSVRMPDIPKSHLGWRNSLLGVEVESLDGQLAEFFGVKEGVLVRSVTQGSAAEKAGIKAGDVITRVDDMRVSSPSDVTSHLRSQKGKTVGFVLMRDRKEVSLSVTVPGDDRSEWYYSRPFGHPALL